MNRLVKVRKRPSRDGEGFAYMLDYVGEDGIRKRLSLGHDNQHRAEQQRKQKERELKKGFADEPELLSEFLEDSLQRTGDQIRQSTRQEYEQAMRNFIETVGDIHFDQVDLKHGEIFRQACLDAKNSPATVGKKLRHLKRFFQLGIERGQLDENPLRFIKLPKCPKKKINVFSDDECHRIIKAAADSMTGQPVNWVLLIVLALTTGMRRGELLNLVWADIDFEKATIEVCQKKDTVETWTWAVKDTDRRTLPLTKEAMAILTKHQLEQTGACPYVFVPPWRYEKIQTLRKNENWTFSDSRRKVIQNFSRQFQRILKRAAITRPAQFHDLRRTCLTGLFVKGLDKKDVQLFAGHACFATTDQFYLAAVDGLCDRVRRISEEIGARVPNETEKGIMKDVSD
jgi:integrase